jgi:hypothetical protein
MYLKEVGWDGIRLDSCGLGQGKFQGFREHGNETSGSIKYWEVVE